MKAISNNPIKYFGIAGMLVLLAANPAQAGWPPPLPSISSTQYNITSYGASTGSADNSAAIQSAINAASAAGGGTVVVPSGTFLSGPVALKNNINLDLASGAMLQMVAYGTYPSNVTFISGVNLTNIEVSGSGTVDGQGSAWWTAYENNHSVTRPCMLGLQGCSVFELTGIKMQNAPNSHVGLSYGCANVTINGITISTPSNSPNTDGFDLEGTGMLINNCNISDGDDNIAIDAMHSACTYFQIQNCTFGAGHGCSIGSYTDYGVSFVTVTNCSFNGTISGIRMKSEQGRGGTVQYCYYNYITMTNVQNPIWIDSLYPDNPDPSNPTTVSSNSVTSTTPIWKHIGITNLKATGSSNGGTFYGLPEEYVGSVGLTNVTINATTGMVIYYAGPVAFTNSSVNVSSGNPVTIYDATVSGINTVEY